MRTALPFLLVAVLTACGGVPPTPLADPVSAMDAGALTEAPDAASIPDASPATIPDAGSAVTVRVMTWNTENFFDDVDDPKKEDTVVTTEQAQAKLDALAAAIQEQSPDILALQEVENVELLGKLGAKLGLPNVALVRSYDFRGINVGLATRYPITQTVSHLGEYLYAPDGQGPYRWARDCLEVHVASPAGELVLLVNHQTSQLDSTTGEVKRQSQSRRTREIADRLRAEVPTRPVFIVGDMNDEPPTASVGLLIAGAFFVDVANDVPEADRYTYVYKTKRRYDYLLPDAETAKHRLSVTIPHTPAVQAGSDHAPIVATFGW